AVSHPNVIAVFDAGEDHGEVYIATELVDGAALSSWQRGRPWRQVVAAWAQAARGLVAVHQCGIIHRDVKAANVFVGLDERVRIGDFGIARAEFAEPSEPGNTLSRSGWVAGTPGFMAPEQLQGGPVDARVDQFALCVALGEALLGRKPVSGEQLEFAESARLAQALTRGVAPLANSRFATMAELAAELEAIVASPVAEPGASGAPQQRVKLAKTLAVVALATMAMVGGGAVAVVIMQGQQTGSTAQRDLPARAGVLVDAPGSRDLPAVIGGAKGALVTVDAMVAVGAIDAPPPRPVQRGEVSRVGAPRPKAATTTALAVVAAPTGPGTVSAIGSGASTASAPAALNVMTLEYSSMADDPDGETAHQRLKAGDAEGCLRIVGNEPDGATGRNALRAVCHMLKGQCDVGAARLRTMARFAVPALPVSVVDLWVEDRLNQFCPVWDKSASVTRRLTRLAAQAHTAHSVVQGTQFRQALYNVSTAAVLSDAKLRNLLVRAYIEQLHTYESRKKCDVVDEIVEAADKIGIKFNADNFSPFDSCKSVARLFATPPP
nr:protein kinase [Kofleriaceae bacterium]